MRRVVVIVLSLIVLGPTAAQASAWFRCAHDGELRAACCCPPSARHHAPAGPEAQLRAACCCTITHIAARASSERAAPPALAAVHDAPVMIVAPVEAPIAAPARRVELVRPWVPRGPPDPLFVQFCSLLL
ncbi:MAG TPA: hypothetical protein VFK02_15090 [Kofleriaceae bacterium]|nr:hypothetical protein [Kofleriaceae bacterium]